MPTHVLTTDFSIPAPPDFNFWRTVYSHGWCALPPFSLDEAAKTLQRILTLSEGTLVRCILSEKGQSVHVLASCRTPLSRRHLREATDQLRTCLRLDEKFSEFHHEARRYPQYRWIASSGSGRMLRSPTAFEDVVKMICTTNCTWALTTLMVTNLVQYAGKKFDGSMPDFPDAGRVAGLSEKTLRTRIKAGYRAPFLLQLAQEVAAGRLDIEEWTTSRLETEEMYDRMRAVKGIGPYAAGNLLKLVGRYDYLGLDSWVRSKYCELYHDGRRVKDSTIEKRYKRYGRWRGLFFWLEMTRDWHEGKSRIYGK